MEKSNSEKIKDLIEEIYSEIEFEEDIRLDSNSVYPRTYKRIFDFLLKMGLSKFLGYSYSKSYDSDIELVLYFNNWNKLVIHKTFTIRFDIK